MQPYEAQQSASEHEGVAGPQQVDEILFHLAEQRTEALLVDQANFNERRLDDGADIHAMLTRDALGAHVDAALAVAEQLAPAVIRGQRVAAVLHEAQHVVEVLPRQVGVRRGATYFRIYIIGVERRCARQAQQVLRQHIEATGARRIAIQFARGDTEHGGLTFQHLEAVGGHQDRAAGFIHAVIGAADALQQPGHALGSADLDHLIDAAPIDAEVERGRRHDGTQVAGRHRSFDAATLFHLQRAVMQRYRQRRFVQPPQRLEHQFRLGARIDEHDGHAGVADACHHQRRGFQAHVAGPGQLSRRQHHAEFRRGAVGFLDDTVGAHIGTDRARMRHGRGQADATARWRQCHQPRHAQCQLVAALGAGERVHLIHHHAGQAGEHCRRVRQ